MQSQIFNKRSDKVIEVTNLDESDCQQTKRIIFKRTGNRSTSMLQQMIRQINIRSQRDSRQKDAIIKRCNSRYRLPLTSQNSPIKNIKLDISLFNKDLLTNGAQAKSRSNSTAEASQVTQRFRRKRKLSSRIKDLNSSMSKNSSQVAFIQPETVEDVHFYKVQVDKKNIQLLSKHEAIQPAWFDRNEDTIEICTEQSINY